MNAPAIPYTCPNCRADLRAAARHCLPGAQIACPVSRAVPVVEGNKRGVRKLWRCPDCGHTWPAETAPPPRFSRFLRPFAGLFCASVVALVAAPPPPAEAKGLRLTRCTPPVLRAFVRQHGLTVISAYRRGARVRGTGRRSLHSYCSRHKGAIDVRWKRGIVRAALRRGLAVGTYSGCMRHVHISVGGREGRFHKRVRCRRSFRRAGR